MAKSRLVSTTTIAAEEVFELSKPKRLPRFRAIELWLSFELTRSGAPRPLPKNLTSQVEVFSVGGEVGRSDPEIEEALLEFIKEAPKTAAWSHFYIRFPVVGAGGKTRAQAWLELSWVADRSAFTLNLAPGENFDGGSEEVASRFADALAAHSFVPRDAVPVENAQMGSYVVNRWGARLDLPTLGADAPKRFLALVRQVAAGAARAEWSVWLPHGTPGARDVFDAFAPICPHAQRYTVALTLEECTPAAIEALCTWLGPDDEITRYRGRFGTSVGVRADLNVSFRADGVRWVLESQRPIPDELVRAAEAALGVSFPRAEPNASAARSLPRGILATESFRWFETATPFGVFVPVWDPDATALRQIGHKIASLAKKHGDSAALDEAVSALLVADMDRIIAPLADPGCGAAAVEEFGAEVTAHALEADATYFEVDFLFQELAGGPAEPKTWVAIAQDEPGEESSDDVEPGQNSVERTAVVRVERATGEITLQREDVRQGLAVFELAGAESHVSTVMQRQRGSGIGALLGALFRAGQSSAPELAEECAFTIVDASVLETLLATKREHSIVLQRSPVELVQLALGLHHANAESQRVAVLLAPGDGKSVGAYALITRLEFEHAGGVPAARLSITDVRPLMAPISQRELHDRNLRPITRRPSCGWMLCSAPELPS